MTRSCELCSRPARMYCESDEARLCWDCDEKVHSANFLVAKHSRSLLCHACQSPTPWKASGTKLSPTVSVCEDCFDNSEFAQNPTTSGGRTGIRRHRQREEEEEEEDGGEETDQTTDMDEGDRDSESSAESTEDDEEEEEADEEEDGENQVVPWASCPSPSVSSAPPLTTSCSSSELGSFSTRNDALKRSRGCRIQDSDDDDACCSSQANSSMAATKNANVASLRAAKMARVEVEDHPEWRRRMELVGSLMSFQESTAAVSGGHSLRTSEVIRRISELSRDAA